MFNQDKEKLAALQECLEMERAGNAGLQAEIDQMRAERDDARRKSEVIADEILTIKAEIQIAERMTSEANARIAETAAKLATADAKLATFDADVEKAAAARFAGLGGDPIPASGDDGKADLAGLTGLARATAAHQKAK